MRLLLLADREPRPSVRSVLASQEIDAVIGLGDLQPSWVEVLADARIPKFGVYGNHDEQPYMPTLGMDDLHLAEMDIGGLVFTGFEGCVRYKRGGAHQYSQRQARRLARRLPGRADVLVCHCPPEGINDDPDDVAHQGFAALRSWVDRVRPRYVLHGHTYPQPGRTVSQVGDTRIVHVSGARLLDL